MRAFKIAFWTIVIFLIGWAALYTLFSEGFAAFGKGILGILMLFGMLLPFGAGIFLFFSGLAEGIRNQKFSPNAVYGLALMVFGWFFFWYLAGI